MKKIISITSILTFLVGSAFANPINPNVAKTVAANFFINQTGQKTVQLMRYNDTKNNLNTTHPELYIFVKTEGSGFVIVSGDDATIPILGYSTENRFAPKTQEGLSPELTYWLGTYVKQIDYIRSHQGKAPHSIQKKWQSLLTGTPNQTAQRATSVSPLLTTTWGQWPAYNDKCPQVSSQYSRYTPNGRVPAGCVATSMSEIMQYWGYPEHGIGSHSYTSGSSHFHCSANFGATTYQWNNMPNSLTSRGYITASQSQINAVATLMYQCGVAIDMNYTYSGSGAYVFTYRYQNNPSAQKALAENFGYNPNMEPYLRRNKSESQWVSIIRRELNNNRPFIYTGSDPNEGGHAWVCDGYDDFNKYHMNWGWRGSGNGYYSLSDLSPSSLGAGAGNGHFNSNQGILTKITPGGLFDLQTQRSSMQASSSQVHYGSPFDFNASIKNVGDGDFDGNNDVIYFAAYEVINGQTPNPPIILDTKAHNIVSNGTFNYNYSSSSFTKLQPGKYILAFLYGASGSNDKTPIKDGNAVFQGYTMTVLGATGIASSDNNPDFKIYPNPANGFVNVSITGSHNNIEEVQIFDNSGREVLNKTGVAAPKIKVSVRQFPAGMYQMKIMTAKGESTHSLIIK